MLNESQVKKYTEWSRPGGVLKSYVGNRSPWFGGGTLGLSGLRSVVLPEGYKSKLGELFGNRLESISILLDGWHRALINGGTPVDFAAGSNFDRFDVKIDGKTYPMIGQTGIDHGKRREIIKNTPQHTPRRPSLSDYDLRFDPTCLLDLNIAQAIDASVEGHTERSNALADLGDYLLMVNKFPCFVTDCLVLAKRHDDISQRASYNPQSRVWTRTRDEQTRGALLSPSFLKTVFDLCERLELVAHRNHALDGMTVPLHDHFKVVSRDHPHVALIPEILGNSPRSDDKVVFHGAENAPFDSGCLTCSDTGLLALHAANLLNRLEQRDQIFTLVYTPGTLIITPRRAELYGNGEHSTDYWTGSTVGYHGIDNPDITSSPQLRMILDCVYRKGQFSWDPYLEGSDICVR